MQIACDHLDLLCCDLLPNETMSPGSALPEYKLSLIKDRIQWESDCVLDDVRSVADAFSEQTLSNEIAISLVSTCLPQPPQDLFSNNINGSVELDEYSAGRFTIAATLALDVVLNALKHVERCSKVPTQEPACRSQRYEIVEEGEEYSMKVEQELDVAQSIVCLSTFLLCENVPAPWTNAALSERTKAILRTILTNAENSGTDVVGCDVLDFSIHTSTYTCNTTLPSHMQCSSQFLCEYYN
jgi:hypothetical protein